MSVSALLCRCIGRSLGLFRRPCDKIGDFRMRRRTNMCESRTRKEDRDTPLPPDISWALGESVRATFFCSDSCYGRLLPSKS